MRKLSTFVYCLFIAAAAVAAPTANEDFVIAEDAQTFTNAVNAAKNYTDQQIAGIQGPDFSTNNTELVETIGATINGGTISGGITVWGDSAFYGNVFSFSDSFKIKFMDAVMTPYFEIFGYDIGLPLQSGTLALTSDIPTTMAWSAITGKPTIPSTAADIGALPIGGGTITGNLTIGYSGLLQINGGGNAKFQFDWGSALDNLIINAYRETSGSYSIRFPTRDGSLALTSDIPTSMAWGAITDKPTTIIGYGITDALKSDFDSLTNNTAFTSAVAAVSPSVDPSGYCTPGEAAEIASNVVTQTYIRHKLGVYLYVGEDGGIYVHTEE